MCASDRAVTFSDNGTIYQLMHFEWFAKPADIFDAFDFTCVMGAWDVDRGQFEAHTDFLHSIAARRLTFHGGTRFPIASLLRTQKYQERGYAITRGELLKIGVAIAGVTLNSWDDLKSQIGGAYGNKIALVEDGEFTISKALDTLSDATFVERPVSEEMPGTAEGLLSLIFE